MAGKLNPFDGAWRKGRAAALAALPESANPYHDKRKPDGRLSWSRAWQKAWDDGYNDMPPRPPGYTQDTEQE